MSGNENNNFFEDGFTSDNSFDAFDGFNESDDFSFENNSDFGDSSSFGDTSDFFGDSSSTNSNESQDLFDESSFNSDFQDSQNNSINNNFTDNNQSNGTVSLNKKAYIVIAVGIAVLITVILVAGVVNRAINKKANTDNVTSTEVVEDTQVKNNEVQYKSNVSADDIIKDIPKVNKEEEAAVADDKEESSYVEKEQANVKEEKDEWIDISADESSNITFNEELAEMQFTVTGIRHKARTVDSSETLVVKTTLTGSISGLPGTYEIDIPYDKGIKIEELGIGTSFTINVQLGEFKGRTVVGNITY